MLLHGFTMEKSIHSKIAAGAALVGLVLKIAILLSFSHTAYEQHFLPFLGPALNSTWWFPKAWELSGGAGSFPYGITMLSVIWPLAKGFHYLSMPGFGIGLTLLVVDIGIFLILVKGFFFSFTKTVWVYWLSPILIFVNFWHGQFDLIPMFLLLLSFFFFSKYRYVYSALFMAFAINAKSSVALTLPIFLYAIYLRKDLLLFAKYFLIIVFASIVLVLPFLGVAHYAFGITHIPEIHRLFSAGISYGDGVFLALTPFLLIIIYLFYFRHHKVNLDLLLMYTGLVFVSVILFSTPAPGWYLWPLPFFLLYFIKTNSAALLPFVLLNVCYVLFFVSRELQLTYAITYWDEVIFAGLQASIFLVSANMYWHGIRSNRLYRQRTTPFLIGIAGDSAAGKDTLTNHLIDLLGSKHCRKIDGDDDHRWERSDPRWREMTHLNPKANDLGNLLNQLEQLRKGARVLRKRYDHSSGTFTNPLVVQPKKFIFIQGLHPFYMRRMRALIDLKIFLDTDENLRRFWKVRRDMKDRGYTKEQVLKNMENRQIDGSQHITPQREHADLIVSYSTLENIQDKIGTDLEPPLKIAYRLDNSIPLDFLLEYLEGHGEVEHQYDSDLSWQWLRISKLSPDLTFEELANATIPNLEEIVGEETIWATGYAGLSQYLALVLLASGLQGSE